MEETQDENPEEQAFHSSIAGSPNREPQAPDQDFASQGFDIRTRIESMQQEINRLTAASAVQEVPFGELVRQDPQTFQGLFEKMKPFFPK